MVYVTKKTVNSVKIVIYDGEICLFTLYIDISSQVYISSFEIRLFTNPMETTNLVSLAC